jgi:zinc and cadmium transporter
MLDVFFLSVLGGVVSLSCGILLLQNKKSANQLAQYATPFAAGALLAAVFLDLLIEGVETNRASTTLTWAFIGVRLFFMMERFLRWFHHHHDHADKKSDPSILLIILGDTLHNALDGVAIAASYLISPSTAIITTLAVAAHEIPQEIGDMGLLMKRGLSRRRVIIINICSAAATVFAAMLAYSFTRDNTGFVSGLLGLSAGFLLYVALSDLVPTVHQEAQTRSLRDVKPILVLVGALFVGLLIQLSHRYVDHDEADSHPKTHSNASHKDERSVQDHHGNAEEARSHQ